MATAVESDTRDACMYWERCYRKNKDHLQKYRHPPPKRKSRDDEEMDQDVECASKKLCTGSPTSADNRSSSEDEFVVPKGVTTKKTAPEGNTSNGTSEKDTESEDEEKEYEPDPEIVHEDYPVKDSPEDVRMSIEQKFLLELPEDFYQFWDLCTKLNKDKPEEAFIKAGLMLVGPYDVLTGKLKNVKIRRVSSYICHWRYYYDPPEFMTVIAGNENEFHLGYYRDDPFLLPNFAASMSSLKPGVITPLGENIFAAVCLHLSQKMKAENPFKKTALQRLYKEVESYAMLKKLPLEAVTPSMRRRNKVVVSKTFHGAGIVVPIDRFSNVGYRPLPDTEAALKRILKRVVEAKNEEERLKHYDDVHELITNVQFAFDEGDHGMGLELGLNLFTYGGEVFHKSIYHLLSVAYDLMGREPYIDIIQAHLKNRRRGTNLSILESPES